MNTRPGVVIILAAGEGKRMKSAVPKVLHPIAGRSLVGHVIEAAAHLEPEHVVVVVGHGREYVVEHLAEIAPWVVPVVQDEQRGTGQVSSSHRSPRQPGSHRQRLRRGKRAP